MTADEDQSLQLPPAVGVSSILRRIKGGLNRLGLIRIEGEIHFHKPYPSGHVYLDLNGQRRRGDFALRDLAPQCLSIGETAQSG